MQTKIIHGAAVMAAALLFGATAALAQGLQLKPGWVYAIAFPDPGSGANSNGGNGNGGDGPGGNGNPGSVAPTGKSVALYKIVGAADQNWYRVRPIARSPQGALIPVPGSGELWVNLNFAMWVQEVLR